jgi:hypothetical protein
MTRALGVALTLFVIPGLVPAKGGGAGWGTIKGRVVWAEKKLPEKTKIDLNGHMDKAHCLSKGDLYKEEVLVHPKSTGVRYVCVWLAPVNKGDKLPVHPNLKKVPETKVTMGQPCCAFVPRAVALREGQTLLVTNESPVVHNYRYLGDPLRNTGGSVNINSGGTLEIKNLMAQKAPLMVACDHHKWMHGAIFVFDHPYFAMTDEDGNFEIPNAPAGTWDLIFRHESGAWNAGNQAQSRVRVTIPAGKEAPVRLDWKAPAR